MASSTSNFQIEDQTDEDFFDKLVDDEFDGSQSKSEELTKVLSNLSLGDINNSLDVSVVSESADKVETTEKVDVLKPEEAPTKDLDENYPLESSGSFDSDKIEVGLHDLSTGKSDGSKGTSVKEVQWSAFSVDSSQEFEKADGFEPYLNFLAENADGFAAKPVENFSSNTGFTMQQDTQRSGSANKQIVDQNDPTYWESLYPGWKYDTITGQWYQVDTYDGRTDAQSDNSKVASADAVSETLGASYLQQTSQPALETIAEECTVSSVSNYNTQVGMECPSNMVFDPQYPEWYYDTITQQWYTLESYTQGLENSSIVNAVLDQLPEDVNASTGFRLEQNHGLYSNFGQDEQHGANESSLHSNIGQYAQRASQNQGSQDVGQTRVASMSNYDQRNSIYNNISQSEQITSQLWGSQDVGQNWSASVSMHAQQNSLYSNISPTAHHAGGGQDGQDFGQNWDSSINNYAQQKSLYGNTSQSEQHIDQGQRFSGHSDASKSTYALKNMWQTQPVSSNVHPAGLSGNQQRGSFFSAIPGSQTTQQTGFQAFEPVVRQNYGNSNGPDGFHSFAPTESMHKFNQPKVEQTLQAHLSNSYYGDQNTVNYPQQSFQGTKTSQFSYAPSQGRSSAGRPPHAFVAFGFGGKLIVMKNANSFGAALDYGSQENASGVISVFNLSEVVKDKDDASGIIPGSGHGYFHALCQPSFPGPLVGGNAAAKDVNKWMDEKIAHCESTSMGVRTGEFLKLLLSLLKIMCQHYGKLRSPFGADPSSEEIDGPESAVTKLFASARNNGARLTELGSSTHCMQNLPSEGQIQATAIEVQNLLVSGRRNEALQYAQEGQLWGPALVLAAQLGEKFYVETVKKMARQFVSGSPLRTLCLLIAGQPADVFSADPSPKFSAANAPHGPSQMVVGKMLLLILHEVRN